MCARWPTRATLGRSPSWDSCTSMAAACRRMTSWQRLGFAALPIKTISRASLTSGSCTPARWYRLAADHGHPQAQYNLALSYAKGEGVSQDYVSAHMWFNLAAAQFPASEVCNHDLAVKNRTLMANKMTREQIAEAQNLARGWKPR